MTHFMQACDVFESFKVVLGDVFEIESNVPAQLVYDKIVSTGEIPIAVVGAEVISNPKIKAVSDGAKWVTIDNFIKYIA